MINIVPYSASSVSARTLTETLKEIGMPARRLKTNNSKYVYKEGDFILNWGSSRHRIWEGDKGVLNNPSAVSLSVNKFKTLATLHKEGVKVPQFTDNYLQALEWIHNDGFTMASRTELTAHSGKGMVISSDIRHLPKAHLFTQFNESKGEYRIHVFGDTIIDLAKKRRKTDEPPVGIEKSIRSHDNGWIFARSNKDGTPVPIDDVFKQAAIDSVKALGLHFGAVDVLNVEGSPVVLEVNSAPGMEGNITRKAYAEAIKDYYSNL